MKLVLGSVGISTCMVLRVASSYIDVKFALRDTPISRLMARTPQGVSSKSLEISNIHLVGHL